MGGIVPDTAPACFWRTLRKVLVQPAGGDYTGLVGNPQGEQHAQDSGGRGWFRSCRSTVCGTRCNGCSRAAGHGGAGPCAKSRIAVRAGDQPDPTRSLQPAGGWRTPAGARPGLAGGGWWPMKPTLAWATPPTRWWTWPSAMAQTWWSSAPRAMGAQQCAAGLCVARGGPGQYRAGDDRRMRKS